MGKVEAAELLLSKGAAVDAKNNDGPGPRGMGSRARNRVSNLGHLKKFFRLEILRKMFAFSANVWERCDFLPQKIRNQ